MNTREIQDIMKKIQTEDNQSPKGKIYHAIEQAAKEFPDVKVDQSHHKFHSYVDEDGKPTLNSLWVAPKIYGTTETVIKLFTAAYALSERSETNDNNIKLSK